MVTLRHITLIVAVYLVVGAWLSLYFETMMGNPLLSKERAASARYSPWVLVDHDAKTGEAIYERDGNMDLPFHIFCFTQRRYGDAGVPDLWRQRETVRAAPIGIVTFIAVLSLAGISLLWHRGSKSITVQETIP
jgi:hypothetical protein